ncbi:hypothetical protein [Agarilytica rhodophyticola]|uniref:hypothetical protein n=1 Tax=Agarilytica rhodophyticola TaxID=1737490 RepID=UPI000B341877|nr:hypothetical protein [Agarilytica rhodophyticola]
MSTVTVIIAIVCLLGVLVSYAFVQQTVKNKQEHRTRMLAALKSRSRTFKYMLNGFPNGFLSKELVNLVQKSLVDVYEQLSMLEPEEDQHIQDLQIIKSQMTENQRQAKSNDPPSLENPQQIKEVKVCLEELHKFVFKLEEKQTIPKNQGQYFRNQIKQMVTQVTVDSYCLNGNRAKKSGKTKLAIHYFETALSVIAKAGKTDRFNKRITKLKETVEELKVKFQEEMDAEGATQQQGASQQETEDEWAKFSDDDDMWKKKNVYD